MAKQQQQQTQAPAPQALPWMTAVREKLEDPAWWGFFMPFKNAHGTNASTNLYHDFEQTTAGDCGVGVECGEYVWNHRNGSMLTVRARAGPWAAVLRPIDCIHGIEPSKPVEKRVPVRDEGEGELEKSRRECPRVLSCWARVMNLREA